jgi:myo-inositol-1(or 4)-monophosphatase
MNDHQLDECYNYVLDTILKCGEIMKKGSKNLGTVKVKEFWWDLVTEYDRKIENVFIEEISKKYPDHK